MAEAGIDTAAAAAAPPSGPPQGRWAELPQELEIQVSVPPGVQPGEHFLVRMEEPPGDPEPGRGGGEGGGERPQDQETELEALRTANTELQSALQLAADDGVAAEERHSFAMAEAAVRAAACVGTCVCSVLAQELRARGCQRIVAYLLPASLRLCTGTRTCHCPPVWCFARVG